MVAVGQVVTDSGGGGPHTHPWSQITGEPTEFPPEDHAHPIADIASLQTALDAKAAAGHGHAAPSWTDVTDKPMSFPPSTHAHVIADTTGLQGALDGKSATGHGHTPPNVAGVTGLQVELDSKSDIEHTHDISDVDDLQDALDAPPRIWAWDEGLEEWVLSATGDIYIGGPSAPLDADEHSIWIPLP